MTLSQGLDRNKTQHLSHESVQGQAWVPHLSQEHDSHQCATWGHPWHLLSSPSPNPSVCPPWKEDQLSATTWRNKWDKWPARTTGLPGQMTITVTSCGGQCLGQKLLQSISFQDKCNMNLNWLMVHVSNESTHIHMDHKHTITKWIPHDWNLRLPNIEACTASHTQRSPGTCSARNRQMYTLGLLQRKLDDLPSFHDDFMLRPAPLHEATLNEANCQSLVLVFEHNRSFQDWSSKGICDTCTHPWQN